MSDYQDQYFQSGIFDCDYHSMAECVCDLYAPATAVDVGCGPGHLTNALAALGVNVTAVDGYAKPSFDSARVSFSPLDFNVPAAVENFFQNKRFDLAICMEVVEHLEPDAADRLVTQLMSIAPVVVFSAGIPGQGGHGHINLRTRQHWHERFTARGFLCADRLRERLRKSPRVAPWYRFNALDYVRQDHPKRPEPGEVIARLVASESAATSVLYEQSMALNAARTRLSDPLVKAYISLRRAVGKLRHGS